MYNFLREHLPPALADTLIAIWYVFLVLACLFFMHHELGEFRYADW